MRLGEASHYIHKIIDPVVTWACNFGMYALVIMVVAVVVDVLMRASAPWVLKTWGLVIGILGLNEVQVFMMVALTFLSIAYVGVKKGHIAIELFVSKLSAPHRAISKTINDLLALAIVVTITWRSVVYAIDKLPVHTQLLHLPYTAAIFLITVGAGLLSIVILADALEDLSEVIRSYRQSRVVSKIFVGLLIAIVPLVIVTIPIWLHWLPLTITPLTVGVLGLGFMLALMGLGLPIAYAMAIAGFIGIHYLSSWPAALMVSQQTPYYTTANYFFIVIPLFILMGSLCATSRGIATNLFYTVDKWMGPLPGGLAMATVGGCAAFGAVCGDTLAAVATMGKVALPEMKKYKYDGALRTGCVAAGGTLGIMIPPSIVFIFYAVIAEESIGKLFIAGILPGILIAFLMMVVIYIQARRNPALAAASRTRATFLEKLISLKGVLDMLILFALVIGGIYGGWFTPVEAGAIGAAGALLIGLARRFMSRQEFAGALLDAARINGMLLLILVGVGFLATFLAQSHLPAVMGDYVAGLSISRWIIFFFIVLMYIVLGCIMNIIPAMLLSLPIVMPTILVLGFDPIWFGVIMVLMVMIGQITPPVGVACFVTKGMDPDVPLPTIFRGILPLWGCMVVVVILLAVFPQIALFLPTLMRGG